MATFNSFKEALLGRKPQKGDRFDVSEGRGVVFQEIENIRTTPEGFQVIQLSPSIIKSTGERQGRGGETIVDPSGTKFLQSDFSLGDNPTDFSSSRIGTQGAIKEFMQQFRVFPSTNRAGQEVFTVQGTGENFATQQEAQKRADEIKQKTLGGQQITAGLAEPSRVEQAPVAPVLPGELTKEGQPFVPGQEQPAPGIQPPTDQTPTFDPRFPGERLSPEEHRKRLAQLQQLTGAPKTLGVGGTQPPAKPTRRPGEGIEDFTKRIELERIQKEIAGVAGKVGGLFEQVKTEGVTGAGGEFLPGFAPGQVQPPPPPPLALAPTPITGQPGEPQGLPGEQPQPTPTPTPTPEPEPTPTPTPTPEPPPVVGTSASERAKALREGLGLGDQPTAPDLFTGADTGRLSVAQQERTAIDEELTGILDERLRLQEEFRKFERGQVGLPEAGRRGAISEEGRQVQDQLEALNRRELVLETKLRNRNTTINELMRFQQQDFANATALYNSQFSQAIQIYNLFDKEDEDLQRDAKANLDVLGNMYKTQIEAGQLTFDQLSGVQRAKLEELELQAGLPAGSTLGILQTLQPGEEKLWSGVSDDGTFTYITKDAQGNIKVQSTPGAMPGVADMGDDEKREKEFWSAINRGVNELQQGETWGNVWNRIKGQFSEFPNEVIDNALGTSWRKPGAFQKFIGQRGGGTGGSDFEDF